MSILFAILGILLIVNGIVFMEQNIPVAIISWCLGIVGWILSDIYSKFNKNNNRDYE